MLRNCQLSRGVRRAGRGMSVDVPAGPQSAGGLAGQPTIAWLQAIAERHDLSISAPDDDPCVAAIVMLLNTLSREFRDYREVVAGARDAARRNAEHLAGIVRSTGEQGKLVRATGAAAAEAAKGASLMADAAAALQGFAHAAADAAADAGANLASIDGALGTLVARLADGDVPLAQMRRSTAGIAAFQTTLARLSRHAQLLAVNAQIEASHLAEAGSRFAIVAQEVRKLSASTRDSKADVAQTVAALRQATEQVALAVRDSKDATAAAGQEIAGASEALSRTREGIDEFERMVATIVDLAATQSMSIQAITSSVDQIWQHADEAADASREAARLDLDLPLERAQTRVARWTLRDANTPAIDGDAQGEFVRWIDAVINGADAGAAAGVDANSELRELVAAVRALLERVAADGRDVLRDVVQAAVAVSRNGYAWRAIFEALAGVTHEIEVVRAMVGESANAARTSVEIATGMRSLVDTIRHQYDSALQLLAGGLTRISSITGSVHKIDGFVESMGTAAARAGQIVDLIDTLSSETDLLSFNAAIEAAHAGNLGLGFGVIAEEIRSLARSTNNSTGSVSKLVASIGAMSGSLQSSIGIAAASTDAVGSNAERVRGAITTLGAAFESAMEQAADVSSTASDQTRALDRVLENVNNSGSAVETQTTSVTDRGRLELAMLGSRAHAIAARRPLGTVVERVRALTEKLCTSVEAAFESALAGGRLTPERLFDFTYHRVEDAEIASLGRLFDVSRVPESGFIPPKYATPWDALVDEALLDVLTAGWDEAVAASLSPVAIFIADLNGFFYAYPRQKIAAWTGEAVADNPGNRIKRFFEDEYTLRVVRCGLGPQADDVGPRSGYGQFRAAGCELARAENRPWGGYVYARDTNAACNEVVMALYARDMRHGTLRVCYDPNLI
jgi:methyl-accepting chemotaxis protein